MKISVVVPAFRPTYLRQAIASVLTQGPEDFELLVGDDSGEDALAHVLAEFRDPRIRVFRTAGRTGGMENLRMLWRLAEGEVLKILHDDDLLLPNCLAELLYLLERNPAASLIFGHRDVISADGRVTQSPRLVKDNVAVPFDQQQMSELIIPSCTNRIGEFPNVLINRASGVSWEDLTTYQGFAVEMLTDVALFLNAPTRGPVIGAGRTVAQFRRHAAQNSVPSFNPSYAKVVGEWEIFVRGEHQAGRVTADQARAGAEALRRLYEAYVGQVSELSILQAGLPTLVERIAAGDSQVLDADFRRSWASFDAAVNERRGKARLATG